jgi:hypothetical protein
MAGARLVVAMLALVLIAGCSGAGGGTPDPEGPAARTVAYVYSGTNSGTFTSSASVLSGYALTMIDRDTTTITSALLSGYDLVVAADEPNAVDYMSSTLSNAFINSGKPVIGMGMTGSYLFLSQTVAATTGLKNCGGMVAVPALVRTDATCPIWSTPNSITGSVTSAFVPLDGQNAVYMVSLAGWPGSFATNGLSIATVNGFPAWHVLAREQTNYLLWGICGSVDELNQAGKDLFANAVHYMLN